ncbi:hypothetical protein PSN45_002161 [Yamadazyma tenuis]|uniref:Uncharacterized protein n=1 Tax=Candida tenuis (strain ATCC 10573 / BCRC 21748 / CBS 615 / JCM 9827 / NBRC 10315 / NRRL Y-1498 / VKM Y-70) TaxID=590646 RepID=G3BBW6_CANTC|nr:uncharacterized protein CANTEDRAFT_131964 [Yamadazyma tenuis ATCC 10573]EGV60098.1 hypothetical protein CANTEDRAFT_131964 [Yamadazyma tenuis ATCC 10573]WEJ94668.1 hypothetical protein PSN45_002161 [Yamadazyma tenuis]
MKTSEKLRILGLEYPDANKEVLRELLVACDDSLVQMRLILDQSFQRVKNATSPQYQSSVDSMLGSSSKKRKVDPHAPPRDSRSKVVMLHTEDQVREALHPYVSLHRNFLPREDADKVLVALMNNKHRYNAQQFYLFDQVCKTKSRSAFYYVPEDFVIETARYNGIIGELIPFDESLTAAAKLMNKYVNERVIPHYKRLEFQQPKYSISGCVVNYFPQLSDDLGWHSDRLQSMGPQNYIGSISFGSTREFRLRRHSNPSVIYSIHIPHNGMLLMHPGCQELFKHCVNSIKVPLQLHPICGVERYSVTFRDYPEEFTKHVPKCKCGIPMVLRRSFKTAADKNFGKYYWSCENTYQNKDCKEFHWADFTNHKNKMRSQNDASVSQWKAT